MINQTKTKPDTEELILSVRDAKMIIKHIDGGIDVREDNEFNSLVVDMEEFVNDNT